MISQKLTDALNEQIQKEMASAYLYLGMATHFESVGLRGFAHWMHLQAHEEMEHAMKIYHFMFQVAAKPVLKTIPEVKVAYDSAKSVVELVLQHEQMITASVNELYTLASTEKDYKTMSFLQWFIDEQVEEEDNVNGILDMFKYGDNNTGLMMIDHLLGKRE